MKNEYVCCFCGNRIESNSIDITSIIAITNWDKNEKQQEELFSNDNKDVKEDILNLLSCYSNDSLDYLADKIDVIEPELLEYALDALASTYNHEYSPIFVRYENHDDPNVRNSAKEALSELSKSSNAINE